MKEIRTQGEKKRTMKDWHKPLDIPITEWLVALFTLVIMVSSIVYTVYARKQWRIMRESNNINREGVEAVQRAFVSFRPEVQPFYKTDKDGSTKVVAWEFAVPLKSSGATAPKDLLDHVFIEVLPDAMPSNFNFHDLEGGEPAVITPNESIIYVTPTISSTEHSSTFRMIRSAHWTAAATMERVRGPQTRPLVVDGVYVNYSAWLGVWHADDLR